MTQEQIDNIIEGRGRGIKNCNIEKEVNKMYPSLPFNYYEVDPSIVGLNMSQIRKINYILNIERNKYRKHLLNGGATISLHK